MIDKPWFKSKSYGLGSYSSGWEGWTVLLVWSILAVYIFRLIDKNSNSVSDTLIDFFVPFILLVILLIFILAGTGKKYKSTGYLNLG